MTKIDSAHIGFVWVDVWQEENGKVLFEPYVVKRDGMGRSAKYTIPEILSMQQLVSELIIKYGVVYT